MAALAPSPAAVTTWRRAVSRTSPAAKMPGVEVFMFSSVTTQPFSVVFTASPIKAALGRVPMKMNTPLTATTFFSPLLTFLSTMRSTRPSPSMASSTLSQMGTILGFFRARSATSLSARNWSRRCTM